MQYTYPLSLRFRLIAWSPRISVVDSSGQEILFIKQKAFKLKEDVRVYKDSTQTQELYTIKADRILDISAEYTITESGSGRTVGAVKKEGLKSILKANYVVKNAAGAQIFQITEANPWVKVANALLESIPFGGLVSGFVFHPRYEVKDITTNQVVMSLEKRASLFDARFAIEQLSSPLTAEQEQLVVMSLLMVVQLEKHRG